MPDAALHQSQQCKAQQIFSQLTLWRHMCQQNDAHEHIQQVQGTCKITWHEFVHKVDSKVLKCHEHQKPLLFDQAQ